MGHQNAVMGRNLLRYLIQMHGYIFICEQAMGTDFFDARTLRNVLNIVFTLINLIQIFFNGSSNKLRSIALIGITKVVLILIAVLTFREFFQ